MAGDRSPFAVRIDLVGGRVEVIGQLGRRTAHLVQDAVSALLQTDGAAWVLDVAGLTGCDRAGVRVIGGAYRWALRHGRRLALVGARPSLQAELARLRLDGHLLAAGDGAPSTADRRSA
ncbi:STAS domain-containing protein [Geodermatophilus marinus]|uniref:STAS domain-containing protein n=1 Tax=Geodermatophilus sp. LHW52908 TaxID=2303986 RepID=UPI001F476C3F|nr:STAS domain-containing protein [Geodermatophilus sp. LHW52908]